MHAAERVGKAFERSGNHLVWVMLPLGSDFTLDAMAWNFGDILVTTFAIFLWAALIWMFIGAFADIFRRTDLSGLGKAGWIFLIVVIPFLGVLVYLIARPASAVMDLPPARGHSAHGSSQLSAADEIEKARLLLTSGAITPAEFEKLKQQALARNEATDEPR